MPVIIKPLLPKQGEEALSFIQPYEFECANLASEILRGCENCWAIYYVDSLQAQKEGASNCHPELVSGGKEQKEGGQNCLQAKEGGDCLQAKEWGASNRQPELVSGAKDQKLAGIFALKKKRSLFHCLPFAKYKSAFDKKVCSEAQKPLAEFFEKNEPFCVNGEAVGSVFVRNILKNKKSPMKPSVVNKYFLMVSGEENESCPQALERRISRNVRARDQARANSGIEALSQDSGEVLQAQKVSAGDPNFMQAQEGGGLKVFTAGANDFSRLLPLELGYQREEVVPPSFDISDQALSA
ncbi:MAG: hypothetical protein K6A42_02135, partial [Treponema sp.]|nr:hypothetical protein [Treponema sp.]